jgi:hypothetical protein
MAIKRTSSAWIRANPFLAVATAAGLIARIGFWAVTDRRLDDALITIKFDKNLAAGVGFVHNLGSGHVQGFTSALSVLVPLPGELIASGGGFVLIRLVSLACFVAAMVYASRICRRLGISRWPTRFVLAYLALDFLQIYFGIVGMETQMAVAVLLAGIYYVIDEDYTKAGLALGLAVLARPDFVLWVGPALIYLLLRNWRSGLRSTWLAAVVIAPWVIFTTIYYGSPIPNTIYAKSAAFGPPLPSLLHLGAWVNFLSKTLAKHAGEWMSISPFYEKDLVLKAPIANGILEAFVLILVALAIVGAIRLWSVKGFRPAIAYVLIFEAYKLVFLTLGYFDWYGPPAYAVFMIVAAGGLDTVSGFATRVLPDGPRISRATIAAPVAVIMALAYVIPVPYLTDSERRIQRIEDNVRAPLGKYLGQVVKVGQSYTSESSGYVGWYSNGTLDDFPGLESPRVVHLERAKGLDWADPKTSIGVGSPQAIAYYLRPDWLVLRPVELANLKSQFPATYRNYRLVKWFGDPSGPTQIDVGGMIYWSTDQAFAVLRRVG